MSMLRPDVETPNPVALDLDVPTGVRTRAGFLAAAPQLLRRAECADQNAVLLVVGLDGLEAVNDAFGHAAGDSALRLLARVLVASTRRSDLVARWGGGEFCVLLVGSDADHLVRRLRRYWQSVQSHPSTVVRFSFSVGGATFDPRHPQTIEALFAAADAAMYEDERGHHERLAATGS